MLLSYANLPSCTGNRWTILHNTNMGIKTWMDNWKRKQAERAAEQKRLDDLFEKFLAETEPLTPKASKHPQAALFRHAWKRATVLSFLYDKLSDSKKCELYKKFTEIAAKRYFKVAPENMYGKVALKMTPEAANKLLAQEGRMRFADMSDDTFASDKFSFKM